jgi:hypothetical protein
MLSGAGLESCCCAASAHETAAPPTHLWLPGALHGACWSIDAGLVADLHMQTEQISSRGAECVAALLLLACLLPLPGRSDHQTMPSRKTQDDPAQQLLTSCQAPAVLRQLPRGIHCCSAALALNMLRGDQALLSWTERVYRRHCRCRTSAEELLRYPFYCCSRYIVLQRRMQKGRTMIRGL